MGKTARASFALGISLCVFGSLTRKEVQPSQVWQAIERIEPNEEQPNEMQERDPLPSILSEPKERFEIAYSRELQGSLEDQIAEIEFELNKTEAIERLNDGSVDEFERSKIGQKLLRLDELRVREIDNELVAIQKDMSELKRRHEDLLRSDGIKP